MVIIFLVGINALFAISWLLHGVQQDFAAGQDKMIVFRSFKKEKVFRQEKIKVEIFNACGVQNVARSLATKLRENSNIIDVVFYDNFKVNNKIHKISSTLVIDRKDKDKINGRRVARLIGVKDRYVIHQLSPQRIVDVTILIGKDYLQLAPFQQ